VERNRTAVTVDDGEPAERSASGLAGDPVVVPIQAFVRCVPLGTDEHGDIAKGLKIAIERSDSGRRSPAKIRGSTPGGKTDQMGSDSVARDQVRWHGTGAPAHRPDDERSHRPIAASPPRSCQPAAAQRPGHEARAAFGHPQVQQRRQEHPVGGASCGLSICRCRMASWCRNAKISTSFSCRRAATVSSW
jgi:hypothetical protein